ncbi:hypothetical protein H1R20_g11720, partial [Candolleomyces eurysporus]
MMRSQLRESHRIPGISSDDATPKTIVIIGAGPTGLAALKAVLDTPQCKAGLWKPILFESRATVGGVWYVPDFSLPEHPAELLRLPEAPSKPDIPPATPLYDSLTTNLPHPLMCYADLPFPPSTPVFPKAPVVQTYLESYASHFGLRPYIMFNHPVSDVTYSDESKQWLVKTPSITIQADLLMVCNGHYGVPRYPQTPGVSDWLAKGKGSHSMWYRHPPDPTLGWKTVLIIGAGPSGQDLTADFREAGYTVIHSTTDSPNEDLDNAKLKRRPRISRYESADQGPLPLVQVQARAVLKAFAHPETLDLTVEAVEIMNRYQELRGRLWGSLDLASSEQDEAKAIYKVWHRYEPMEQYDYRDHLCAMINDPARVPAWHREMYMRKDLLRRTWVALEKSGEADEWLRGVGEGGEHEWVDLLRGLVAKGEEREKEDRAKL